MAHHTRTWTDAELVPGFAPTGTDFAAIDAKTETLINGDEGGEWGPPTEDLEIGGAGVVIAAASTVESGDGGGTLTVDSIEFAKLTDDDFFATADGSTLRSQTKLQTLASAISAEPESVRTQVPAFDTRNTVINANEDSLTVGGLCSRKTSARFVAPLRVYNGATFATATLSVYVGEDHASIPQSLPRFRIVRVDDEGTVEPLKAASATVDAQGFTFFTGASWNEGLKTHDYACDQNAGVNVAAYAYLIDVIDEGGEDAWSATGNTYTGLSMTFSSILFLNGQD